MKTIEYDIINIDYTENDAYLIVNGKKYYFQWNGKNIPTIEDALDFFVRDSKFYCKRSI